MNQLEFHAPSTLARALDLLATGAAGASGATDATRVASGADTRPLAGGSDLIVQMRSGRARPHHVVDLKRIPTMIGITRDAQGWLIGAATPCVDIGEHAELRASWPGVVEAACLIGSAQIQGRASLGGNLCNASPAADSIPALMAAGATCIIGRAGAGGASGAGGVAQRELPVEQFPVGPGRHALAPGELLLALRLPVRQPRSGDAYLRLIPRTEMDIAVVGAAVALTVDAARRIVAARIALGAVAPTAVLVPAAADMLLGSMLDEATGLRLEAAARAACKPIDDKRGTASYRTRVAGVLARRAALIAYERACGAAA